MVLTYMRQTEQTKLSDFSEPHNEAASATSPPTDTSSAPSSNPEPVIPRPKRELWQKTISADEEWGVCELNDTVILVRLINSRMYAYGEEAVCKWCGGVLEVRDDKIFCTGVCKRYQGEFSRDLNSFLEWDGVKSYTLRKAVAKTENLELESRDLEPIDYAPDWSILYEYEDVYEDDDLSEE
jgi:hypothetical protein